MLGITRCCSGDEQTFLKGYYGEDGEIDRNVPLEEALTITTDASLFFILSAREMMKRINIYGVGNMKHGQFSDLAGAFAVVLMRMMFGNN